MNSDRILTISYGNGCNAKFWSNKTTTWKELCDRLKTTIRTTETVAEYHKMSKADRNKAKDHGGFVGGMLRDNRRKIENVDHRSMLTLDADDAGVGFIDSFTKTFPCASCLYTTHSHTPEKPRCRIIVPLKRDVTPDEYVAVARYFAYEWGIDKFDECSFKTNQMMYWASTPANGEYLYRITEGIWLNPEEILSAHPNWRDFSTLPTSSRESAVLKREGKHQEDPLTKNGVVGAFCRTYGITAVIEKYLSDIYEPSVTENRYSYIPGEGSSGVVIYEDKFAYSHHATDPACGKLLNAFDLVRTHLFRDMDEKESFKAMCDLATRDNTVNETIVSERQAQASDDFFDGDWLKALQIERNGLVSNTLRNLLLILKNDENVKGIVFNQLADGLEIEGDVPWQHPAKFWRDADDAQLVCYIDTHYGTFSAQNYSIAVTKVADDRSYHPIREYFGKLPAWDGIKRMETIFIDYLGAENNEYVRAVTRKTLCAAYRRIYEPGTKFDSMPVLNGPQGIGKSTLIAKLGMEWFSDSLSLSDMNDKTAAEKLQGYWLMEIGELAGMKKADIDKVKAFVSRTDDKYRASFGRRVASHPRQCVFIGTTNAENGYLRDTTGNRRYWNIRVSGNGKYKPWDLTKETVEQIWAETAVLAKAGEELFLPSELEQYASQEQRKAMEQDEREGLVLEYLDTLLPDNWDEMDSYARRNFIRGDDITLPKGTHKRTEVSNIEIWCECFGKPKEDMKPSDSYAITTMMVRLPEWERSGERKRIPFYGQQRTYIRKEPCQCM